MHIIHLVLFLPWYGVMSSEYHPLPEKDEHSPETLAENLDELKQRIDCFNDIGPCNEPAAHFKEQIPFYVKESCARCDSYLRQYIRVFIELAKKNFPKKYEELRTKYDATGIHMDDLEQAVKQ